MKSLLLAFLVLTGGYHPKIVDRGTYHINGCDVDPVADCLGEWLVIENRSLKPVPVTIKCSGDFDEQTVTIPARSRFTVNIELTIPVVHPACYIKH